MMLRMVLTAFTAAATVVVASASEPQHARKTPLDLAKERLQRGQVHKKIILGSPAPPGAYPFQVSMLYSRFKRGQEFDGHFCGATMIAATWVLTAAHCVSTEDGELEPAKSFDVYVGSQDFRNGDRIPVKSVHRHPKYNHVYHENDVALLLLARAPKPGTKYKTIELIDPAQEATYTKPGVPVTIVGWGTTEQDTLSQVLQHATINIVDRPVCDKNVLTARTKRLAQVLQQVFDGDLEGADIEVNFRVPDDKVSSIRKAFAPKLADLSAAIAADVGQNAGTIVTEEMICAGEPEPKASAERVKDTCQGDSGGPLIAKTQNGTPIEVGIVSWGEGCGVPTVHGVYTRLGKYVDWVKATAH